MIDHVKLLLMNRTESGIRHVEDVASDAVMALFGVTGAAGDSSVVDRLLPLALAPDLARFRRFYDSRTTPNGVSSIYRQDSESLSPDGLYDKVLGHAGWWTTGELFRHDDPAAYAVLSEMRMAASSWDAPYALGAVLLAVAYRRWLMQGREG